MTDLGEEAVVCDFSAECPVLPRADPQRLSDGTRIAAAIGPVADRQQIGAQHRKAAVPGRSEPTGTSADRAAIHWLKSVDR